MTSDKPTPLSAEEERILRDDPWLQHDDPWFITIRRLLATLDAARSERSAVIGAARRFLAAHDRVIGSGSKVGVTRDDAYAMSKAADDLRDVLRLHDENAVLHARR